MQNKVPIVSELPRFAREGGVPPLPHPPSGPGGPDHSSNPSYATANCSVALLQLDPGSSAAARAKVGAWRRWRSLTPMQQSAWERGIDSHRGSFTVQDSWLL